MKRFLIPFFSIFCVFADGQSIYDDLNHKNYRKSDILLQEVDPDNFKPELLNAAIFFATNEIRAKKKLGILKYHPLLSDAATIHSKDMAERDFFSHTNKKNKKHKEPDDRARVVGITNPKIAENIIEGFLLVYKSGQSIIPKDKGVFLDPATRKQLPFHTYISLADQLMVNWMSSDGHKANILSEDALELGCGTALFIMNDFNDMPAVKATQNFQWFYNVSPKQ